MPTEVPPDWLAAMQQILREGTHRVLVLGARDAGKSTFCSLLLLQAEAALQPAALLDVDPGQKLVGPPGCVTLGYPTANKRLVLSALTYLGALEPLGAWSHLISGSAHLAAEARVDLLVINSCGLLRGPGRRLKRAMITALEPDLLIAIGEDRDLEAVLADQAGIPVRRLARSPLARRKGEGERRALRQAAFQAYFESTSVWALPILKVHMQSEDGQTLPAFGRLAALVDGTGRDMALALVVRQSPTSLFIRSPRTSQPVARLRWSRLGLDMPPGGINLGSVDG